VGEKPCSKVITLHGDHVTHRKLIAKGGEGKVSYYMLPLPHFTLNRSVQSSFKIIYCYLSIDAGNVINSTARKARFYPIQNIISPNTVCLATSLESHSRYFNLPREIREGTGPSSKQRFSCSRGNILGTRLPKLPPPLLCTC
jgi:hypothetical protein